MATLDCPECGCAQIYLNEKYGCFFCEKCHALFDGEHICPPQKNKYWNR